LKSIDLQIIMFLNYVPIFLCGSKVTLIIRYQNFVTKKSFSMKIIQL